MSDLLLREGLIFSYGFSPSTGVFGFCFFDKYCFTNIYGFEILT